MLLLMMGSSGLASQGSLGSASGGASAPHDADVQAVVLPTIAAEIEVDRKRRRWVDMGGIPFALAGVRPAQ